MMSALDPENEYEALMHVVDRLHARFPECGDAELRQLTAEQFQAFENAHVRDFIPVLVERQVAARLRSPVSA